VDSMQEGLHTTVFNNTATHVFFRTRDYHDADYLAHVLDGERLTYRDLKLLGVRQCYIATTHGERPLDPVLVTLPPLPPTSPTAPGSQPSLGLSVQRAGPGLLRPKRPSRRHKGPRLVPVGPVQLSLPPDTDALAPPAAPPALTTALAPPETAQEASHA